MLELHGALTIDRARVLRAQEPGQCNVIQAQGTVRIFGIVGGLGEALVVLRQVDFLRTRWRRPDR